MKKYIICISGLTRSNGVKAMYNLANILSNYGYESYIYPGGAVKSDKYNYLDCITRDMEKNDIIIYPEVVKNNPCRFRNVVRYILYYPGILGGNKSYYKTEMIFTWDKKYYNADVLYQSGLDRKKFVNLHKKRIVNCVFVHKGGRWKKIPELDNLIEINMDYPKTKNELIELLNQTNILYSFDKDSVLNEEALLCGVNVKIVTNDGFEDYISKESFNSDIFNEQVRNFINKTQNMKCYYAEPYFNFKMIYLRYKIFIYRILYSITNKEKFRKKIVKYQLKIIKRFIGWDGII